MTQLHIFRSRLRCIVALVSALAGCGSATRSSESSGALRATGRIAYYHATFAAGPAVITRDDGSVLDERRHEPFGAPIGAIDYALDPHNALNQETDVATGWSDHGARWLTPETARWLTPDPPLKAPDATFMARPWALHPYQYVEQNPIVFWDPDGREPEEVSHDTAEHHSTEEKIIHTVHTAESTAHVTTGLVERVARIAHSHALHSRMAMLEAGQKSVSGGLAAYHFIGWMRSEPGTEENYEHAGATVTNVILTIAPTWLAAMISGAELLIPNFNREIGRPITQADLRAAAQQKWAPLIRMDKTLDAMNSKLDTIAATIPQENSCPVPEAPVYGPPAPRPLGPPAPEPVSRPDPADGDPFAP